MISLRDVVTGFGVRDPLAEVWRRSLRGGGGGAAEITGIPPLRYIGDGRPLTDYRISGNAVQDGTPSPDAPVDAAGCGVRTGNLFDITTLENGIYLASSGNKYGGATNGVRAGTKIKVLPNTAYTISAQSSANVSLRIFEWSNGTFIKQTPKYNVSGSVSLTVTTTAETTEIAFNIEGENGQYTTNVMLNLGSTALPYEPYGYKLPLTVNGVEYPIYLGKVETTRRIKKLVLTGEEDIAIKSGNAKWFIPIADMRLPTTASILWFCSHYQAVANNAPWASYDYVISWSTVDTVSSKGLRIRDVNFLTGTTVADFKSYLAQQYAAGTPVTVWYVLAEPETAIVNEPLMKIGDYADTVSLAQAGVTIPTVNGENVLDVPTEVPPSEVTIKGGISSV